MHTGQVLPRMFTSKESEMDTHQNSEMESSTGKPESRYQRVAHSLSEVFKSIGDGLESQFETPMERKINNY